MNRKTEYRQNACGYLKINSKKMKVLTRHKNLAAGYGKLPETPSECKEERQQQQQQRAIGLQLS
eukprot:864327-Pelagomonas_calceolata.AAC.6